MKKVTELIKKAKKPLIFSGGGVILSRGHKELTELARLLKSGLISLDEYEQAKQKIFKTP